MVLVKGKNAKHLFVDFIAVSYTITIHDYKEVYRQRFSMKYLGIN